LAEVVVDGGARLRAATSASSDVNRALSSAGGGFDNHVAMGRCHQPYLAELSVLLNKSDAVFCGTVAR